eukprot:CAMPEP_0171077076 /NCGR_PEP_ID=MMETSP0766_2-20121228/13807_1 /TAXON_ID=439317 /ORGANISM="Gambierdiscus australes, Strain CAWD 149" /LENGTH=128 /DNA_ID=CAMNT_0011534103 /DNA_START=86 /DNA_END=472 /DNA_ORIENTATION=-
MIEDEPLTELVLDVHGRVEDKFGEFINLLVALVVLGIELCYDHATITPPLLLDRLRELCPDRGQFFTMLAPGYVELYEDVAPGIKDMLVKVFANQHPHPILELLLRHGLAVVALLDLSSSDLVEEGLH